MLASILLLKLILEPLQRIFQRISANLKFRCTVYNSKITKTELKGKKEFIFLMIFNFLEKVLKVCAN